MKRRLVGSQSLGKSGRKTSSSSSTSEKKSNLQTFVVNSKGMVLVNPPKWVKKIVLFCNKHRLATKIVSILLVITLVFTILYQSFGEYFKQLQYRLSPKADALLVKSPIDYGSKLVYDQQTKAYYYNKDYNPTSVGVDGAGGPRFTAKFNEDPQKGIEISDPTYKVAFTFKPKFRVQSPIKQNNRLIYPLYGNRGAKVVSLGVVGMKEDIIIENFYKDTLEFEYELVLPDTLDARLEKDGSIGIYGTDNTVLLSDVSASSESDAKLLENARKNATKNKLVFTIPAPYIRESGKKMPNYDTKFELKDNILTIKAFNLRNASYPLSIDPSVYVETAAKLMRGNNETNTDFDIDDELIQKSQTTGARIDSWEGNLDMSEGIWDHGTAAAGGYIYRSGGRTGITKPQIVGQQATADATDGTTFVMDMPATRPAGDLYIALMCHDGTITMTAPSGWTEYADTREHAAFYKVGTDAGGGNEAASYTWTGSGSEAFYGVIIRVTGFDAADPISGTAGTGSNAADATPVFPATTPVDSATLVVRAVGADADTPSGNDWVPSGHTKIDSGNSGGTSCGFASASLDASPAAGVSTGTATFADSSINDTYGASSIAITPDGAIPAPQVAGSLATSSNTDTTSFQLNMPSTRPAGDLYIALFCHDGTVTVAPPGGGGWTEYADTREHAAYYKIGTDAGGGNEASSYTWTGSGAETYYGVIIRVTGFDPADPLAGTPGTGSSGSNTTPVYPTMTPDANKTLIIRSTGVDDDVPTATGWLPAGHTKIDSGTSGGTNDCGFTSASLDSVPVSGVATGTSTLGEMNDTYGASTIAIKPDPAAIDETIDNSLDWASFNSSTLAIESPNPGDGVCDGWCNDPTYNLPSARAGHTMVAYNGYLYVMGGVNSSGTRQSTVYIAKIGANGEPQLWHPTDTDKNNWDYWYEDTALNSTTARSYFTAAAYNNRMYLLGGQTNASSGGTTTSEYAEIKPNGTLASWTSGTALPSARHSHTMHIYNDTIYLIGGNNSGTLQNSVYFVKLNSDGSMNSWVTTTSFSTARSTLGSSFSTVWGAYIYLSGGCTAVNGSGYCTTIASDTQIGSINADGTISEWGSITNLTNARIGYSFIGWQNGLYRLGGCTSQDSTSGKCLSTLADVDFGVINPAGEVSTVSISVASGTSPCSGASPYNCNLPPTGDDAGEGGQIVSMSTVLNGYLYVIGGCIDYDCNGSTPAGDDSDATGNVSYVSINSDGQLTAPSGCSGTSYGAWCVDSTNRVNGTTGVAAAGVTTFGNRIYIVGGLTGSALSTDIYYNDVNVNGSLNGAWESVDMTTAGISEDVAYTWAYARANPGSAGSNPGNLYVFGGCGNNTGGLGCAGGDYETEVYKCNITTTGNVSGCSTSGQQQIDSTPGTGGTDGLGAHSGTVNANYIYLIGGLSQAETDKDDVLYAKFDNSNNIVAVSGSDWIESPNKMSVGRRRGFSFGYNGHIYSVGGYDADTTQVIPFIEWSKMNVSDGSIDVFVTSSITINQRWGLSMVVSNSYAYVFGGCDVGASPGSCSSFEDAVQIFKLYNNDSGTINNFTAQTDDTFATNTDRIGASAAVYNGYLYVAGGCTNIGCSTVSDNTQYAALSASDGTVGTWNDTTDSTLPAQRAFGQLEIAGGTLYYFGGIDATGDEKSDIYYGTLSSGNISAWTTATSTLPADRAYHGGTVWNDRLYLVGGIDDSATVSSAVYVSPQMSSGGNMTGSWQTSTSFNVARTGVAVTAYANNLYIFGGYDGTNYLSDVQFATIGYKTGTISQSGTAVTGSGTTFTSSMVGSTIQYPDGSTAEITAYSSATSITVDVGKTVTAGTIYSIQDGSVGSWTYTSSLPGAIRDADAVSANGYIYLVGGRSAATTCAPNILITPIVANTTIATGNNPTGTGEWYETNVRYGGGRYGAAVAYDKGKLYTMGGGCSAPIGPSYSTGTITQTGNTVTGAGGASWNDDYIGATITYQDASTATVVSVNSATSITVNVSKTIAAAQTYTLSNVRNYYSTVKSQPQVAIYSRMIDTDSDVFPNSWLMNGVDNSIGARWQVRYRSMHDLDSQVNPNEDCGTSATMAQMTTWGQETNFGNVTLGDVSDYNPLNGTGGNINCARYYYFFVSIDASKTFGYPEDVSRGPTISDISLFFTSDPSKRLRHGKTFTGGEQQPLDTPCRQTVDSECPEP